MIINSYRDLIIEINKIIKKKSKINVMLTGGKSIIDFYKFLLKNVDEKFWKKSNFYLTDERLFELSKNTNYNLVKKILFKNTKMKDVNLNKFFIKKKTIKANISYFDRKLKRMDIIFLSYAKDGHIASLFPNLNPKIIKKNVCYVINHKNKFKYRISVTESFISKSRKKYLFFIGNEKRRIYRSLKNSKFKNSKFFKNFNFVLA